VEKVPKLSWPIAAGSVLCPRPVTKVIDSHWAESPNTLIFGE
jgi:hypothetical protein